MTTLQYQVIDPHIHAEIQHLTECHCRIAVVMADKVKVFDCYTFDYLPVADATLDTLQCAVQQAKQSVHYMAMQECGRGIL